MTLFNLNCFLTANGNNAQTGGTWKFGTVSVPLSGWTNGGIVSTPSALDTTNYSTGSYPFIYELGSPPCAASTTYNLVINPKITSTSPGNKNLCVLKNIVQSNIINIPITYTGNYIWSASSSNGLVTIATTSGTGTNSGNITLTIDGSTTLTTSQTSTITVTVTPNPNPFNAPTGCVTYSPTNANPCGSIIIFDTTVQPNINAGVALSTSLCSGNLLVSNLDTLFTGTLVQPSGYTKTYLLNGVTTITSPYTFNPTPTTQTVTRRISNGTCTDEVTSTITIVASGNAGNSSTITICN